MEYWVMLTSVDAFPPGLRCERKNCNTIVTNRLVLGVIEKIPLGTKHLPDWTPNGFELDVLKRLTS
jgi:hypothetical protein